MMETQYEANARAARDQKAELFAKRFKKWLVGYGGGNLTAVLTGKDYYHLGALDPWQKPRHWLLSKQFFVDCNQEESKWFDQAVLAWRTSDNRGFYTSPIGLLLVVDQRDMPPPEHVSRCGEMDFVSPEYRLYMKSQGFLRSPLTVDDVKALIKATIWFQNKKRKEDEESQASREKRQQELTKYAKDPGNLTEVEKKLLRRVYDFDIWYSYSDDGQVFRSGVEEESRLKRELAEVGMSGAYEHWVKLQVAVSHESTERTRTEKERFAKKLLELEANPRLFERFVEKLYLYRTFVYSEDTLHVPSNVPGNFDPFSEEELPPSVAYRASE